MSPYVNWHVGMKVVCVDDEWSGDGWQTINGIPCPLKVGAVYTVERLFVAQAKYMGRYGDQHCVDLREVRFPGRPGSTVGFNAKRFRPVQPRKSDISIFTAMLQGTNSKVSA